MNKTETGPVLMVLTFLLVLKRKAAAHSPPVPCAIRATLTPSGHNTQLPKVHLVRNSRRQHLQDFRDLVNYGINGSQPVSPSHPESPGTHLRIPGVSHLVMSLRNISEEQRRWCQVESGVSQSKESPPPSRPPHPSQGEMSEIGKKIQRPLYQGFFAKINFNGLFS